MIFVTLTKSRRIRLPEDDADASKHVAVLTFSSPTNAHVKFIKTKLKLRRLLQHVSVYKETIIREPVNA